MIRHWETKIVKYFQYMCNRERNTNSSKTLIDDVITNTVLKKNGGVLYMSENSHLRTWESPANKMKKKFKSWKGLKWNRNCVRLVENVIVTYSHEAKSVDVRFCCCCCTKTYVEFATVNYCNYFLTYFFGENTLIVNWLVTSIEVWLLWR